MSRRRARVPGIYRQPVEPAPTCVDCRLYAARLHAAARARYQPPLGVKLRVRVSSGGFEYVCPRCHVVSWPNGTRSNLADAGVVTQRDAKGLTLNV